MRVLPYGRYALLVEADDPSQVLALAAALSADEDVLEVVPAARTVLARTRPSTLAAVRARIGSPAVPAVAAVPAASGYSPVGDSVLLDVTYDGADLRSVADETGLDVDAVVRLHTGTEYVVAFCGFAPGFAYLTGSDERLHVGRLAEPRTRVPAGAVGVAGEFTGVYPRASPGGWRLLGRTDAALWDATRDPPALLTPGTRVRFRAVR